ncbi:MAG TPA: 4Fe-4S binding protein [Candidatus Sulfotelmatobacter sp.]|nr:4Fe-4S binding protein [Candidatus Sulfotelmatobacter sp.]
MNCSAPECKQREATALGRKLSRSRPWVQTGFLAVWLAPLGQWLHGIPGCVFHCYSCPLSSFACPIGVAANYAALFPVAFELPYLLIGVLVLIGALGGSLVCGWACPFGFLQDLFSKIPTPKFTLPGWIGYTRYAVLVGLVLALPLILGFKGIPYEEQVVSICRLCPAGALESGLPFSVENLLAGKGWLMSWFKSAILLSFVGAALFFHRPWCRIFCPLGGLLALFNRFSLFHLRFRAKECIECNLCRSRCSMGVKVDQKVNVSGCIRCLECTTCGALQPGFALPGKSSREQTSQ